MNVAIFTDNDFAKVNGVTTCLRATLRYAPDGIRPRIYTCADLGEDGTDYFAAASVGMRIPYYAEMRMYLPRLGKFLKQVRADRTELVHFTTPGPVGLAALLIAWHTELPVIGSFHTDLVAYTEKLSGSPRLAALMREYLRWSYGRCARILVPSEDTRGLLVRSKIAAERISLWTRGVDTHLFTPSKRSEALRERWRVCDRRPAIIYVGRVSKEKGLERLPEIQSLLHRHGLEHRLVIVGDGPYRRELQARLPDAVFTGTLAPPDVAVALASADLFLFPSDTDSAGNVVLEAQACGLPVIVSDAGGPKEYVRPDVSAFVCRAGDLPAYSAAAAQILRSLPRRRAMGTAARAHAETVGWEAALAPLYSAYRQVAADALAARSPSRPAAANPGGAAA